MPTFRGPKNVLIQPEGAEKAAVASVYDHASRQYVATLSDEDAATYRSALLREGCVEDTNDVVTVPASTPAAADPAEGSPTLPADADPVTPE